MIIWLGWGLAIVTTREEVPSSCQKARWLIFKAKDKCTFAVGSLVFDLAFPAKPSSHFLHVCSLFFSVWTLSVGRSWVESRDCFRGQLCLCVGRGRALSHLEQTESWSIYKCALTSSRQAYAIHPSQGWKEVTIWELRLVLIPSDWGPRKQSAFSFLQANSIMHPWVAIPGLLLLPGKWIGVLCFGTPRK